MKLVKKKYYNATGEAKINNYFVFISKSVIEKAGWTGEEQVRVYTKDGRIIIEKEG